MIGNRQGKTEISLDGYLSWMSPSLVTVACHRRFVTVAYSAPFRHGEHRGRGPLHQAVSSLEVLNISVANFKRAGTARRFGWWFRRLRVGFTQLRLHDGRVFFVDRSSTRHMTSYPCQDLLGPGAGYFFPHFPQTAPLLTGGRLPRKETFCICPWRELGAFFLRELRQGSLPITRGRGTSFRASD